ncbi:MAG: hypothetical protein ACLSCV_00805 [Acutalibacteraceae bacterium]
MKHLYMCGDGSTAAEVGNGLWHRVYGMRCSSGQYGSSLNFRNRRGLTK